MKINLIFKANFRCHNVFYLVFFMLNRICHTVRLNWALCDRIQLLKKPQDFDPDTCCTCILEREYYEVKNVHTSTTKTSKKIIRCVTNHFYKGVRSTKKSSAALIERHSKNENLISLLKCWSL